MREPRIVVNTRSLGSTLTGVQRYALEIVTRLGERVQHVAPASDGVGVRGHLWEQFRLPLRLADAVLWSPANTGPLAVRRQVVTIHDLAPLDHPEWLGARFAAWYRFLLPRLAARVARVIAVSSFTKERIVDSFAVPENKVVVIPNGVDPRFRPCSAEEASAAGAALGVPSHRYFLSLCSLEPRKNLHRLLSAWGRALPSLPDDISLVVAGLPGRREVFGEFSIGELPPRVVRVGRVGDEHLPALYSGALAFVYPSVYEGFGLPPLEAMAAGAPVLTGNLTSLPEVVGDAGLMVDPLNEDALADGLIRLALDAGLRERLRRRGVQRAGEFTWDEAARRVEQVLREVAAG